MGYLHEAWKNTPSTVTTQKNARGQCLPSTTSGGYTAEFAAREAERYAALDAARKAARAEKAAVMALAMSHFGDGIEICGLRSSWPLEGHTDGWRVHAKGASNKTLGFVASFADRLEAWSVSVLEEKPHERLGEVAKVA